MVENCAVAGSGKDWCSDFMLSLSTYCSAVFIYCIILLCSSTGHMTVDEHSRTIRRKAEREV